MNNRGAIHLHRCLEGGLPQRPSWSSAPSSPRSDSGSESSAPGSRRGHRGRRQGSRPRRGKGRSDLRRGHHRGQRERETEREGGAMMKETKEGKRRFRDRFNQIWITRSILTRAILLTLPGDSWCESDLKRKPISCGQKPFRPPVRILWFPGSQNVEEGICLAVKLASR